jgi:hypothetical protein
MSQALKLRTALLGNRTGAVLVFNPGIGEDEASKIIDMIRDKVSSAHVEEFNPDHGSPVWYIP